MSARVPGSSWASGSRARSAATLAYGNRLTGTQADRGSAVATASGERRDPRPSERGDGDDLDQVLRRGEAGLDGRAPRRAPRHDPRVPGRVHLLKPADVGQVDGGGEELGLVAAGRLQEV